MTNLSSFHALERCSSQEEWQDEGESWYCRELLRADVRGESITLLSVYCSAIWMLTVHRVIAASVKTEPVPQALRQIANYPPGRAAILAWLSAQDGAVEATRAALAELGGRVPVDPDLGAMVASAVAFVGDRELAAPIAHGRVSARSPVFSKPLTKSSKPAAKSSRPPRDSVEPAPKSAASQRDSIKPPTKSPEPPDDSRIRGPRWGFRWSAKSDAGGDMHDRFGLHLAGRFARKARFGPSEFGPENAYLRRSVEATWRERGA